MVDTLIAQDPTQRNLVAQYGPPDAQLECIELHPNRAHLHRPTRVLLHKEHATEVPGAAGEHGQRPQHDASAEMLLERQRHAAPMHQQRAIWKRNVLGRHLLDLRRRNARKGVREVEWVQDSVVRSSSPGPDGPGLPEATPYGHLRAVTCGTTVTPALRQRDHRARRPPRRTRAGNSAS